MKNLIKFSLAAILLLSINSCTKPKADEGELAYQPKFKNFVRYYIDPIELWATPWDPEVGPINQTTTQYDHTKICITSSLYPPLADDEYMNKNYISKTPKSIPGVVEFEVPYNAEKNRIYDSLCLAHKDIEYNKTWRFMFPALYKNVGRVMIYSDTDYDADRPAGSSLENITNIFFYSIEKYIADKYKPYQGLSLELGEGITEPLPAFNQKHRKLIGANFSLHLTSAPAVTSTHRFTITYTDEDGKVLTTTTAPITIKGAD